MKKLLSLVLAVMLSLTLVTGAEAAGSIPYTDISADHPHRQAVEFVHREGIMNGMSPTLFDPDRVLSRAMMVTVLYRMAGSPPVDESAITSPYRDVALSSWYGPAVYWAEAGGYAGGYGGGLFGAEDNITRQQFVVVLHRFVGRPAAPLDTDGLSDAGDIAAWAVDGVAWAVEQGILTADGGKLNPNGAVTRAQAAEILMRFVHSSVVG